MPSICLISGDGIGQEVIPTAARVLVAVAPDLEFIEAAAGWQCFQRHGTALPPATVDAVSAADATLFGATSSPSGVVTGYESPILALRRRFDLYANMRPVVSLMPGVRPVDLLIVRENTEGLYSGRERREGDTAIAERVITRAASERIARVACSEARRRAAGRGAGPHSHGTVTIIHKANVLRVSDGLFRESCLAVTAGFPDLQVTEMLVDAAAMWLVKDSARFDVLVTTNLFGDILSDLAAGLIGGLGMAPSANLGSGRIAIFEPVHGSAPDIAGRGLANPIGAILSAALLMQHLGRAAAAAHIQEAVRLTLADGVLPPDLGGTSGTEAIAAGVLARLAA